MAYCDREADPSLAIRNAAPPPRNQRFVHWEVVHLVKGAWRKGFHGLACVIALCWDTQFSPGDVRKARKRHLTEDGFYLLYMSSEGRSKTGRPIIGTMCKRTDRLLRAYFAKLGVDMTDEAFLFRNRSGKPYREDTLPDDFAELRQLVFPGDMRQLRDFRRSGAMEAAAGNVDQKALADKMGNSINQADKLQRTYEPVDLVNVRRADEARLRGRRVQRAENKKR